EDQTTEHHADHGAISVPALLRLRPHPYSPTCNHPFTPPVPQPRYFAAFASLVSNSERSRSWSSLRSSAVRPDADSVSLTPGVSLPSPALSCGAAADFGASSKPIFAFSSCSASSSVPPPASSARNLPSRVSPDS